MSRDPIKPNELLDYINDSTKKYIEQLKEDNARWTCKHTAAEQKYQTQSNVIAELRGRAEKAEAQLDVNQYLTERAERIAKDIKEREQKLKEAIEERLPEMNPVSRELMKRTLATLYHLDREDTNG